MGTKRNGRVFLDAGDRPYWVRMWEGTIWLFRWHDEGNWVSLYEVTNSEAVRYPDNLTNEEQDLYHTKAGSNPYTEEEEK